MKTSKKWILCGPTISLLLGLSISVHAQSGLGPVVIAGGGGAMNGAGSMINATIGQPVVGPTAGLQAGFWFAVLTSTGTIKTDVEDIVPEVPLQYRLDQNYPNPFNPSTTIQYEIAEHGSVELVIINVLGHRVATLHSGEQSAGVYSATWDSRDDTGRPVASGFYLYRLSTPEFVQTRKMLLVK